MNTKLITFIAFAISITACAPLQNGPGPSEVTLQENKELVSIFFEHFSNGEIETAFALVSDDVTWWVPGELPFSGTKTKTGYLQVVGAIKQGFPNGLQLSVSSMIAQGNKVAAEVSSLGEHANGRSYNNTYHFLITIKNGQMIEVKEYMDTLHLFKLIQP